MKRKRKRIIDERTTGRNDQCTPAWLIQRINAFARIGLDPAGSDDAAPVNKIAKVIYRLSGLIDGLIAPWRGFGLVFVNPPYGTEVRLWARKAVEEFCPLNTKRNSDELIMLIAARVDTRWFKLLWRHSTAVILLDRRVTFVGESDPAKFPSALVYFGERPYRFADRFGDLGLVIMNDQKITIDDDLYSRSVLLKFPKAA